MLQLELLLLTCVLCPGGSFRTAHMVAIYPGLAWGMGHKEHNSGGANSSRAGISGAGAATVATSKWLENWGCDSPHLPSCCWSCLPGPQGPWFLQQAAASHCLPQNLRDRGLGSGLSLRLGQEAELPHKVSGIMVKQAAHTRGGKWRGRREREGEMSRGLAACLLPYHLSHCCFCFLLGGGQKISGNLLRIRFYIWKILTNV